jgi:hypothetical protein
MLPGEWPCYDAHDLKAESLLLWLMHNGVGAADLERWHVHVTAHRNGSQLIDETTIQDRDMFLCYKVVTPGKHGEYMLASRSSVCASEVCGLNENNDRMCAMACGVEISRSLKRMNHRHSPTFRLLYG